MTINEFFLKFDCTTDEARQLWRHLTVLRFENMMKSGEAVVRRHGQTLRRRACKSRRSATRHQE
jgi:hypothetical protein